MANEATCYETPTRFARYTVADGVGIERGTILKLTSPNTAAACSADNDVVAGIAWDEKTASDGRTEISAALNGTWGILKSAATVTVGEDVVIVGANTITKYTTLDEEKGYVLGKALETSAATATIRVRMNLI
jgi:hypothetical protein